MSYEGDRSPATSAHGPQGSVWARLDAPETTPSFVSLMAGAAFALFATWFVFTVLIAIAYLTGILTSAGLTRDEFYDRAEFWTLVLIAPLVAITYVSALRAFGTWFANREIGWLDAVAALAITVLSALVLQEASLGLGVLSVVAGCAVVGAYLRFRLA